MKNELIKEIIIWLLVVLKFSFWRFYKNDDKLMAVSNLCIINVVSRYFFRLTNVRPYKISNISRTKIGKNSIKWYDDLLWTVDMDINLSQSGKSVKNYFNHMCSLICSILARSLVMMFLKVLCLCVLLLWHLDKSWH